MGNRALLEQEMVAFLAPSRVSPLAVLPSLDWATEVARAGQTVVSGFSSRLEKEVFAVLARGASPIVIVNAQHGYKRVPAALKPLLDSDRLLIISLGLGSRLNRQNAPKRNAYVASLATSVVFPSLCESSSLFPLYQALIQGNKEIKLLTT